MKPGRGAQEGWGQVKLGRGRRRAGESWQGAQEAR